MDASIYKRKRVFSLGEKISLLTKFSSSLENSGFSAKWSNKSSNVNTIVQNFHGNHFDIVLFGRGIKPENKKLIIQRFRSQNEQLMFIDALAPIVDLIVDQVKLAFLSEAGSLPCTIKDGQNKDMSIEILNDCSLNVKSYELKWLSRSEEKTLFNAGLQGGIVTIPLKVASRRQFIVVTVDSVVVDIREIA